MPTLTLDRKALAIAIRERRGRSSLRIAATETSISAATLSRLERADIDPDLPTLLAICGWLDTSPATFITGLDDEAVNPARVALCNRLWLAWGGDDADSEELIALIRLIVGVRDRAIAHGALERDRMRAALQAVVTFWESSPHALAQPDAQFAAILAQCRAALTSGMFGF